MALSAQKRLRREKLPGGVSTDGGKDQVNAQIN
jgi:hypothetical protein